MCYSGLILTVLILFLKFTYDLAIWEYEVEKKIIIRYEPFNT
jgi:hypothetical protein